MKNQEKYNEIMEELNKILMCVSTNKERNGIKYFFDKDNKLIMTYNKINNKTTYYKNGEEYKSIIKDSSTTIIFDKYNVMEMINEYEINDIRSSLLTFYNRYIDRHYKLVKFGKYDANSRVITHIETLLLNIRNINFKLNEGIKNDYMDELNCLGSEINYIEYLINKNPKIAKKIKQTETKKISLEEQKDFESKMLKISNKYYNDLKLLEEKDLKDLIPVNIKYWIKKTKKAKSKMDKLVKKGYSKGILDVSTYKLVNGIDSMSKKLNYVFPVYKKSFKLNDKYLSSSKFNEKHQVYSEAYKELKSNIKMNDKYQKGQVITKDNKKKKVALIAGISATVMASLGGLFGIGVLKNKNKNNNVKENVIEIISETPETVLAGLGSDKKIKVEMDTTLAGLNTENLKDIKDLKETEAETKIETEAETKKEEQQIMPTLETEKITEVNKVKETETEKITETNKVKETETERKVLETEKETENKQVVEEKEELKESTVKVVDNAETREMLKNYKQELIQLKEALPQSDIVLSDMPNIGEWVNIENDDVTVYNDVWSAYKNQNGYNARYGDSIPRVVQSIGMAKDEEFANAKTNEEVIELQKQGYEAVVASLINPYSKSTKDIEFRAPIDGLVSLERTRR